VAAVTVLLPLSLASAQQRRQPTRDGARRGGEHGRPTRGQHRGRRHPDRDARSLRHSARSAGLNATVARLSRQNTHRIARAAADPSATISDFQFAPATITVHVGDTITWTNNGPSAHTATATNHSFDTGILRKGQSASHTFSQAGTFTYICTIHPFMHGTVVVANAASGTPSTGSPSTSGATTSTPSVTAAPSAQGPTLPVTGFDSLPAGLTGIVLIWTGMLIRRKLAANP
jgi:plastocyanin